LLINPIKRRKMKKDNIPKDEKRRECLISLENERDKRGEKEREKSLCERRRQKKKMKPCLF
jgi:hypothetical protein